MIKLYFEVAQKKRSPEWSPHALQTAQLFMSALAVTAGGTKQGWLYRFCSESFLWEAGCLLVKVPHPRVAALCHRKASFVCPAMPATVYWKVFVNNYMSIKDKSIRPCANSQTSGVCLLIGTCRQPIQSFFNQTRNQALTKLIASLSPCGPFLFSQH